jgi:hypothetical protein
MRQPRGAGAAPGAKAHFFKEIKMKDLNIMLVEGNLVRDPEL